MKVYHVSFIIKTNYQAKSKKEAIAKARRYVNNEEAILYQAYELPSIKSIFINVHRRVK